MSTAHAEQIQIQFTGLYISMQNTYTWYSAHTLTFHPREATITSQHIAQPDRLTERIHWPPRNRTSPNYREFVSLTAVLLPSQGWNWPPPHGPVLLVSSRSLFDCRWKIAKQILLMQKEMYILEQILDLQHCKFISIWISKFWIVEDRLLSNLGVVFLIYEDGNVSIILESYLQIYAEFA